MTVPILNCLRVSSTHLGLLGLGARTQGVRSQGLLTSVNLNPKPYTLNPKLDFCCLRLKNCRNFTVDGFKNLQLGA